MEGKLFKLKVNVAAEHAADIVEKVLADMGEAPTPEMAQKIAALRADPEAIRKGEIALTPEQVRNMVVNPDLDPETRQRAEAFLASVEG
jgi:hypothetical protein